MYGSRFLPSLGSRNSRRTRMSSSVVGMSREGLKSSEAALELSEAVEEAVSFEVVSDGFMVDSGKAG